MKKSLITISVVAGIILASITTFYLLRKRTIVTDKTERATFTISLKPGAGGSCAYRTMDSGNVCVDYTDIQRVISEYSTQNATDSTQRKITINADVHYATEKLSPSTPEPQFRNEQVIHIDKVYSANIQ